MGKEKESEKYIPRVNTGLTRRMMGRRLVEAAVATEFFPRALTVRPETSRLSKEMGDEEQDKKQSTEFDWEQLFGVIDELKVKEQDTTRSQLLDAVRNQVSRMQEVYAPHLQRIERFTELMNERKDATNTPELISLYRTLLGKMRHLKPEEVIPFISERRQMLQSYEKIRSVLERTKKRKLSQGDYDAKGDYYVLFNLVSTTIERDYKIVWVPEGNKDCPSVIPIEPDGAIELSEEGEKRFSEDSMKIRGFLNNYPYLNGRCTKILLMSRDRYGKNTAPLPRQVGGVFSVRTPGNKGQHYVTEVRVNMDTEEPSAFYLPELRFAHEVFGHLGRVARNKELANQLSPEEYYERLVFELKLLSDSDWGNSDATISQLFRKRPILREDADFITRSPTVSRENFMGIITEYPRNIIMHNNFGLDVGGMRSICNKVLGPPVQNNAVLGEGTRLDGDRQYETLEEFCADYLPKLAQDADAGNIRSKIMLWGLKNFKQDLGNYGFIWNAQRDWDSFYVPHGKHKSSKTWTNYCNLVVSNVSLYHAFINGDDEIRDLFSDAVQKKFEERIFYLREDKYRDELFAEGVEYSYYFGNRMEEKSPYQAAQEHLASILVKKQK